MTRAEMRAASPASRVVLLRKVVEHARALRAAMDRFEACRDIYLALDDIFGDLGGGDDGDERAQAIAAIVASLDQRHLTWDSIPTDELALLDDAGLAVVEGQLAAVRQ